MTQQALWLQLVAIGLVETTQAVQVSTLSTLIAVQQLLSQGADNARQEEDASFPYGNVWQEVQGQGEVSSKGQEAP